MKSKRIIITVIAGLVVFCLGTATGVLYVSTASASTDSGGKSYLLPVSSKQLTMTIQPLRPSEKVLAALPKSISKERTIAQQLASDEGLQALAEDLSEFYRIPCIVAEPLTIPDDCFSFERQQYKTTSILTWLAKEADPASFRTAGVLDVDVYDEGYNFLFGQARMGGSVCVTSSARMGMSLTVRKPDVRWHSIVRHELGHTLGLDHVDDQHSVMKFANSLAEHDIQGTQLTSYDWARLKTIHPIDWKE